MNLKQIIKTRWMVVSISSLMVLGFLISIYFVPWAHADFALQVSTSLESYVMDNRTSLTWELKTDANVSIQYSWDEAVDYCNNLVYADLDDWRLPTIRELASILDADRSQPAVNTFFFSETQLSKYWSSTTYAETYSGQQYAWTMDFTYGIDDNYSYKLDLAFARCVR